MADTNELTLVMYSFTFIYMLSVNLILMKFCIEKKKHAPFSYYSMVIVSFFLRKALYGLRLQGEKEILTYFSQQ